MSPPNPAWSRVLIVEGTSGIGKSTLIDRLVRRYVAEQPARQLRSFLHLTQAHTYGPLVPDEDRGTLTAEHNLQHLDRIVSLLEWQVSALRAETRVKFVAVVDTLHLTHCHRPGVLTWAQLSGLDQRLARLGARLLFLHAGPATIWDRGIVARQNEQFITGYARPRFGKSLEEIHRYFVAEQQSMRSLLGSTALEVREMDADGDSERNLDLGYGYWLK